MSRWSYHIPILGYHRVGDFRSDHVPTVSAEAFERQLGWLARWRYQVVPLEVLAGYFDRGKPLPRRTVVITFDDGYEETGTVAWPLLKRFGMPATVFVTPGEVGLPGFVTWAMLVQMARDGFTVGSHTTHHNYLPLVPPDHLPEEIVESKRIIETHIGQPVQCISYPVGGFTPEALRLVQDAGYQVGCTTNRAHTLRHVDRFALRRIKVTERDSQPLLFRVKLSGYYDAFRELKRPS